MGERKKSKKSEKKETNSKEKTQRGDKLRGEQGERLESGVESFATTLKKNFQRNADRTLGVKAVHQKSPNKGGELNSVTFSAKGASEGEGGQSGAWAQKKIFGKDLATTTTRSWEGFGGKNTCNIGPYAAEPPAEKESPRKTWESNRGRGTKRRQEKGRQFQSTGMFPTGIGTIKKASAKTIGKKTFYGAGSSEQESKLR